MNNPADTPHTATITTLPAKAGWQHWLEPGRNWLPIFLTFCTLALYSAGYGYYLAYLGHYGLSHMLDYGLQQNVLTGYGLIVVPFFSSLFSQLAKYWGWLLLVPALFILFVIPLVLYEKPLATKAGLVRSIVQSYRKRSPVVIGSVLAYLWSLKQIVVGIAGWSALSLLLIMPLAQGLSKGEAGIKGDQTHFKQCMATPLPPPTTAITGFTPPAPNKDCLYLFKNERFYLRGLRLHQQGDKLALLTQGGVLELQLDSTLQILSNR